MSQEHVVELIVGLLASAAIGLIGYLVARAYETLATAIKELTRVLDEIGKWQARTEARVEEHERRLNEHATEINNMNDRCFTLHSSEEA